MFKICALALVTAVASVLLRQYRPEYAPVAVLAGIAAVAASVVSALPSVSGLSQAFLGFGGLDSGWLKLLLKALGIAVLIQTSADLCRDNANTALAGVVELAGKLLLLTLAIPLLRAAAEIAVGLINGG